MTGVLDTIWTDPLLCTAHGCSVWQDSLGTLVCVEGGTGCLTWSDVRADPGRKVVVHRANGALYVLDRDTDTGSSR